MSEHTEAHEDDDPLLPDGGKIMSLWDHIGELRSRVVKSALAILIFFVIAMIFSKDLMVFLIGPLESVLPDGANAIHFTDPLEAFIAQLKVSFLASAIIACPIWIYQFWKFIEPALYDHERKYIIPFVLASSLLFLTGVSFCFYIIFPLALDFLIGLGTEFGTAIITIKSYISLLMILVFGFGLIFQTPIILILLAILDLVSAEMLAKNRKIVVVGILVVGAMLTPPDPTSQLGLAIPMYVMYEISILIIRMIKSDKKATA